MALYQIFNGMKSSIIPENLVLLTRSEQFWKKSAHIRPTNSLAFESTLDTKLREFQYRILNLIIFTNEKLHRFKMADSLLCAFCNAEEESLAHLLYFCKASTLFWKELLSWIAVEANIVLNASL